MKKYVSFLLSIVLMFSCVVNVFAADTIRGTDLDDGITKVASIPNVDADGKNLNNETIDNYVEPRTTNINISSAVAKNDTITISGTLGSEPFSVSGNFCSISDNGNVVVYDVNNIGPYRVVFCAVEKNIEESALYFNTYAESGEYDVVTKLYLADENNNYTIVELFGNDFPSISSDAISNLPRNHYLKQFWYAKEFEATDMSIVEEKQITRAGNPSYTLTATYSFNNMGIDVEHNTKYREDCDIRDVAGSGSSTASATLTIVDMWVDASHENATQENSSTISIWNTSIAYGTRTQTAITQQIATGSVTKSGSIKTSFSFGLGLDVKGLNAGVSMDFSWDPPSGSYNSGVNYTAHTNTAANGYWRVGEAELNHSYRLEHEGNYYTVNWTYSAYTNTTSIGNAKLSFKYLLYNLLDYTQCEEKTDTRTISVRIA